MNKKYEKEIELINNNFFIKNKLAVFNIYFDMHNNVLYTLSAYDDELALECGVYLKGTLYQTCGSISSDISDTKSFYDLYFAKLNTNSHFRISMINDIVTPYQENLDNTFCKPQWRQTINSLDLNFKDKVRVLFCLLEHFNEMLINNCLISYQQMDKLMDNIASSIPMIPFITEKAFRNLLRKQTRNILIQSINIDEIDPSIGRLYVELDLISQNILLELITYSIAGYDIYYDKTIALEICQKLNIPKMVYYYKLSVIKAKYLKAKDEKSVTKKRKK